MRRVAAALMLTGVALFLAGCGGGTVPPKPHVDRKLTIFPFRIPVGPGGISYRVGEERSGPAAMTIGPDGTVWIVDTRGRRLLQYDRTGDPRDVLVLEPFGVSSAVDIAVTETEVFVLDVDMARNVFRIVRLSRQGKLHDVYTIPDRLHDGLNGFHLADDGAVVLELELGNHLWQLVDARGNAGVAPVTGWVRHGRRYTIDQAPPGLTGRSGAVVVDGKRIEITTEHALGGIFFLDATGTGFYVILEEVLTEGFGTVDQTIRHYDSTGKLLGAARMPLDEQYVYVEHPFALGPDGNAYALMTAEGHATVTPLRFVRSLNPILTASS